MENSDTQTPGLFVATCSFCGEVTAAGSDNWPWEDMARDILDWLRRGDMVDYLPPGRDYDLTVTLGHCRCEVR